MLSSKIPSKVTLPGANSPQGISSVNFSIGDIIPVSFYIIVFASITINPRSSIKESYEFGGGQTFTKRALAVACFIYATCLDRGLGVHRDGKIASTMYSRVSFFLISIEMFYFMVINSFESAEPPDSYLH